MNYFFLHSLIPFLLTVLSHLRLPTFSIQFLCSEAHILADWRLETRLTQTILFVILKTPPHGPRRKHSLSIVEKAYLQRRCMTTEVVWLLLAYSLPREFVYRAVTKQWTSPLISLLRLWGIMSQYVSYGSLNKTVKMYPILQDKDKVIPVLN
jgi:hypothetical protein